MTQETRHFSKEKEEADMGIGTMIVFIAMILVSAVAAGLLINTAYEVQQQAEETGKIAIKNVATAFLVVNVLGDRDWDASGTNEDTIEGIELKLSMAAGSPDTALTNVIIEITADDAEENLIFQGDGTQGAFQHVWNDQSSTDTASLKALSTAGSDYTAQELRDPDGTFYETTETDEPDYIVSQGCLIRIFIDLSTGAELSPQDWINVKIIPKHGVPTVFIGTAPECFSDRYVQL